VYSINILFHFFSFNYLDYCCMTVILLEYILSFNICLLSHSNHSTFWLWFSKISWDKWWCVVIIHSLTAAEEIAVHFRLREYAFSFIIVRYVTLHVLRGLSFQKPTAAVAIGISIEIQFFILRKEEFLRFLAGLIRVFKRIQRLIGVVEEVVELNVLCWDRSFFLQLASYAEDIVGLITSSRREQTNIVVIINFITKKLIFLFDLNQIHSCFCCCLIVAFRLISS